MHKVPRLFEQFQPDSYNLRLRIDRVNRMFDGSVEITGNVSDICDTITLHSKGLSIISAEVDGEKVSFNHGEFDALLLKANDIKKGPHKIAIEFKSSITNPMHGMYPCYYDCNSKKEIIATQFESHHAREVFPCIDEPEAKATFDVTLITENNVTVLGNMPVKVQLEEKGQLITTFETTPIMSTYLLAWVVGELHKKTAKTKSGVEVNVWATPAQPESSLDFALDIAVRSTDFFDEYFGVPYPLSKCDHVALPDFGSGAMENWGLITYREIALLADPETTSISGKHYIATVVAHELSHQWFGNLVTMRWWNDLWLNESFATMVEYTCINALEPSWNVWLDFASYESIASLRRDSVAGVQPVKVEVNHPDEIGTLFDGAIVYAKGARLMRMLQHYIGEQAFRDGLKNYFKKYQYKNTIGNDLWECLSEASGKDIAKFMNTWIEQPGYPVLHVTRIGNEIRLSQNRLATKQNDNDKLWPITLNSNYPEMPTIFDTGSLTVVVSKNDPIRFNVGNNAHFITHYSPDLLAQIVDQMKQDILDPIDRLQLINEQTLLARAGIISSAELLPIISALDNESTEAVWDSISLAIADIRKIIDSDEIAENKMRLLVGHLTNKKYMELGWEPKPNEDESITKLRTTIIALTIYSENAEALKTVYDLYESTPIEKLDSELRGVILSSVVRHNETQDLISKLLEIYQTTSSGDIQSSICSALTSTKNDETIDNLLNKIKDTSLIKTQDTFRWIVYLIRNKYARTKTWSWIRENWDWIKETFGSDKSYDNYPMYSASALSTPKQLQEYKDFFEPLLSDPALTRVITMGINEITDRVALIERDGAKVKEYLLNM